MRRSALVLFMVFGCSGGVSTQETEIAQLNARVRVLEERLAEVEAKLAAVEVHPHGVQGGAPRSSLGKALQSQIRSQPRKTTCA